MIGKTYDYSLDVEYYELTFVRNQFKEAFEVFEKQNYSNIEDSYMCSIHNFFEDNSHNCVACNLDESTKLIVNFLKDFNQFTTAQSVIPIYTLLLYIMVERVLEYLKISGIKESSDIWKEKFSYLSIIKKWANFIKHPKAFMFVHHPTYIFSGYKEYLKDNNLPNLDAYEVTIDTNFVKHYYSGSKTNQELYTKLINQDNILVMFPNPVELTVKFCNAIKEFVNLIKEDKEFREKLIQNASIYYEQLDLETNKND